MTDSTTADVSNAFQAICDFCKQYYQHRQSGHEAYRTSSAEVGQVLTYLRILRDWASETLQDYEGFDLHFEISRGSGIYPFVPHVCILPPEQKVSDGIYVAICFDKQGRGALVGCAESSTHPRPDFHKMKRTTNTPLSIDVDGGKPQTRYNDAFANPLEIGRDEFDVGKLVAHMRASLDLCIEHLHLTATSKSTPDSPPQVLAPDNPPYSLTNLVKDTLWEEGRIREVVDALTGDSPQIVLAGPPGTGKTWVALCLARYVAEGHSQIVQFHPSYGYEEFVQGLRPVVDNGAVTFKLVPGVVVDIAEGIQPNQPYVLVIDEMNRANIPRVFGELMFLFEYRDQEMRLQYSRVAFKLPPELKFLATMNTADRSIRSLDVALRRRFDVYECPPSASILHEYYKTRVNEIPDLIAGFNKLNQKLEDNLDRHHTIGHTFFMADPMTRAKLKRVWAHRIHPLIEEYFFDQPDLAKQYSISAFWYDVQPQESGWHLDTDGGSVGQSPLDQDV